MTGDAGRRLDGRVAIVTGSGQGVGRGIALAMAGEGARVVLAGRTLSKVESVAAEIAERGGQALALECNVARPEDVERCVATTVDDFGTVDILVNNAQAAPMGELLDVTDKSFELGFRTGPLAVLRFMRACHPHLRGGGVIINLGSGSAIRTDPTGLGAYATVKEGIRVLSRAAACEWGPDGIRVVSLVPLAASPGMVWWSEHDPEAYQQTLDEIPLRRMGDPEADIGRAAVWLASDEAAYVTGTTLVVDGGQVHLR